MGDLIQDIDVVSSLPKPDNVVTFGFLNEKVCNQLILQLFHRFSEKYSGEKEIKSVIVFI